MNFLRTHSSFPFYVFLFSVVMILVVSGLVQQGMFMDGTQYACVSKNLAEGHGSFWFPFLSPFWCQNSKFHFFEHPPLFYFCESLFFKVFGNGFYTEKIFCITVLIINAVLIHKLWKLIHVEKSEKIQSWLPILLWIITPVCFWCFQNNMIEILVSVFILSSVYCMLKFLLNQNGKSYIFLCLAGLLLYFSFLTKGIIGLFPLAVCLIFYGTHKRISFKQAVLCTAIVASVFLGIFFIVIFFNPSASYMLLFYLKERLMTRIGETPTVNYRLEIIYDLISQLLPILLITALVYIIKKIKRIPYIDKNANNKWFWFFLLLGCCGSFPIMITMVQKGFYFMPSLSFFALAFSTLIVNFLAECHLESKYSFYKYFAVASCVLALFSVLYCVYMNGKFSRDEEEINETHFIANIMQNEKTINTDMGVYTMWNYQLYLQRYHHVYMDPTRTYRKYLLIKSETDSYRLSRYKLIKQFDGGFKLYQRK